MIEEPIKILKGVNGQLELYSDKVIIKRKGLLAKMTQGFTKGDKTLYLNQITAIQVKKGGLLNGYIQFTLPGGIESKKGIFAAGNDENSIVFTPANNDLALDIKDTIEKLRGSVSNAIGSVSSADELRKFKQLLDDEIISKEEFEQKKKQLLG